MPTLCLLLTGGRVQGFARPGGRFQEPSGLQFVAGSRLPRWATVATWHSTPRPRCTSKHCPLEVVPCAGTCHACFPPASRTLPARTWGRPGLESPNRRGLFQAAAPRLAWALEPSHTGGRQGGALG